MKVAVHAHLHYADLTETLAGYLRNIPVPFDLFVTLTDPAAREKVERSLATILPATRSTILVVRNKGRDVKPFYTDMASLLSGYDLVGHIHGKKSAFNNGTTAGWLEYLLDSLMGSRSIVEEIFTFFRTNPNAGLVYPATYQRLPYWANTWLSNRGWAMRLKARLGLKDLPISYFSYPVGNMFWARTDAIRPLLGLGLTENDFPEEKGQNDGELMHALERMVTVAARAHGFTNYVKKEGKLVDDHFGIDFSGYFNSSLDNLRAAILPSEIKLVSFDIFDTLLMRALTEPGDIFELMQAEVEKLTGRAPAFRQIRTEADGYLRGRLTPGTEVTLTAIYSRIGEALSLNAADTATLMALELSLEKKFMRARSTVVDVLNFAHARGKKVVLVSDMYLDRSFVVSLLEGLGVTKYDRIYLSSATGRRKDQRTLFPYVLEQESVSPWETIHVGDNEHSDLQIPGDLGITTFHVMRPKELFMRSPLAGINIDELPLFFRISFGLGLVKLFDQPFPQGNANDDLHTFGYFYFGPTLLAFVTWVTERARGDGIKNLYFLARDGEILIRIYQLLAQYENEGMPAARYLEASRRSIGVPFICENTQLDKLLQADYFGGTLRELILIRFGIDLADQPGLNLLPFGFTGPHTIVYLPADLAKVKKLVYHLFTVCRDQVEEEKANSLGYLAQMGMFEKGSKAVVDIGYSGTLQRILNDVTADEPVHGLYMVLHNVFDSLNTKRAGGKGLFGNRIDPYQRTLSIDKYSLFYEMILSSTRGPVVRYHAEPDGSFSPVYAPVSGEEEQKLAKLPVIHAGILAYCADILSLLPHHNEIRWDHHAALLRPFELFLEHPTMPDLRMLAGYSLDDHYCGQGILYWTPPSANTDLTRLDFLWKRYVPNAPLWAGNAWSSPNGAYGSFDNKKEFELFSWYQEEYEVLPGWYKKIGQLFKIFQGKKRLRLVLEDIGYEGKRASKAEEIQAWYDKEYETLPRWYKRFGHLVKKIH